MKVFHFILGRAAKDRANGVNQVVAGLAKYTGRAGAEVRVVGKARSALRDGEVTVRDGFDVTAFPRWGRRLGQALHEGIAWADVVHLHGTYAPHNIWVGRICENIGKPYVVTLHGGLSPERKRVKGAIRKTLYHVLLQNHHLSKAALIHALTEEEATDAVTFSSLRNLTVIPNGVDLEDFPAPQPRRTNEGPLRIGYIGRLGREKNLHALCAAFAAVNTGGEMQLLLAGPPSSEGDAILRKWSSSGIALVGPRFGLEKAAFFRDIDLFVHPSRTDVFSIAAMEALASGTPTLITRTSDASHFAEARAFVMCEPTAFGLERGLRRALSMREDWPTMTRRGRQLVETRLNWATAASDMMAAYESISGRRP